MRHLLPFLALFLLFTGCDPDEVQTPDVAGCTDPDALNFDLNATSEDGSCEYEQAATTACADGTESVEFDGHSYSVVQIGDDCWFAENLRTTLYSNGDSIFEPATPLEWLAQDSTGGQFTPQLNGTVITYGRDGFPCSSFSPTLEACEAENSLAEYGRLYNHWAVRDSRNVCPDGWHVSSASEWQTLQAWCIVNLNDPIEMSLKTTVGWDEFNGTNSTGFNAQPSGSLEGYGEFNWAGRSAIFWTTDEWTGPFNFETWFYQGGGTAITIRENDTLDYRDFASMMGLSVRCIQD